MLGDLLADEIHARCELIHAIDAVFDADPATEAFTLQRAENRVVIVQALADLAMGQSLRVTKRAPLFVA